MELFVDNTGRCFVAGQDSTTRLDNVILPENDKDPVSIWLLDRPETTGQPLVPAAIPSPYTGLVLSGRPTADLEDDALLFSVTEFTQVGSGATLHYEGILHLDTNELRTALQGRKSLDIYLEVELVKADGTRARRLTPHARATALRDIYRGNEGVPTSGSPSYPTPSTILTTIGNLDGLTNLTDAHNNLGLGTMATLNIATQSESEAGTLNIVGMTPLRTRQQHAAVAAPQTLTTNAAKLALTGINAGHRVRVTGEGGRIEEYLGGTINTDVSWLVLRNSVHLIVRSDYSITVNGVSVPSSLTDTDCGWVPNPGWVLINDWANGDLFMVGLGEPLGGTSVYSFGAYPLLNGPQASDAGVDGFYIGAQWPRQTVVLENS